MSKDTALQDADTKEMVADTTTELSPEDKAEEEELQELEDRLGDTELTTEGSLPETEQPKEEVKEPETEEEKTEPAAEETTEAQTQPEGEKASPKDEWDQLSGSSQEKFRQAVNERNDLRRQIDQLKAQEAQVAQEQDLLNEINPETGDYYTPQEISRIAYAQSRESEGQRIATERYELEVQQNQQTLASEASQAIKDFPIFDSASPEYRADLTAAIDQQLGQALIKDETGMIVGSSLSPYQLYKTVADAVNTAKEEAKVAGKLEGQKAAEKMAARADTPSSAPQTSSGDELEDLFDKIKDIPLT